LKCGAGEGWRKSVGPIMWKMKKYYRVKNKKSDLHTIKRRSANWIGHILCRICFLKHIIEWKIKVTGRWGSRCKLLLDHLKGLIMETERGCTRLQSVGKLVWKRLQTCCMTDNTMNFSISRIMHWCLCSFVFETPWGWCLGTETCRCF
jgi:hypothetical protein